MKSWVLEPPTDSRFSRRNAVQDHGLMLASAPALNRRHVLLMLSKTNVVELSQSPTASAKRSGGVVYVHLGCMLPCRTTNSQKCSVNETCLPNCRGKEKSKSKTMRQKGKSRSCRKRGGFRFSRGVSLEQEVRFARMESGLDGSARKE